MSAGGACMENVGQPVLRPFAAGRGRRPEILRAGKGCVIFSALDITSGLLGTRTWGIAGYEPGYSQALMKNILLWAADGARAP
jgi:hypothetical protein